MLGPAALWGDREELLATAVDWLGHIDHLLQRAHFKGNPAPPKPVPRPGVEADGQAREWMPSADEAAAYLASLE